MWLHLIGRISRLGGTVRRFFTRFSLVGGFEKSKAATAVLMPFSYSPNIVRVINSRRMTWAGHVACMGEERRVYRVLLGKPEVRRPLGRPRRRWVDIRMDLQEVGCEYMDWIGLAQDRDRWRTLVIAVMNLRVP